MKKLYINKTELRKLNRNHHLIGLHSHSHPTKIENLSYKIQMKEYKKNKKILSKKINDKNYIKSMSHPCGSYNGKTKKILKKINIELGFRSNLKTETSFKKINNSNYEIAREDHANILRSINKNA